MGLVVGIQAPAIVFLKGLVGFLRRQSMEGKLDVSYAGTVSAIDTLDCRIGRIGIALTISRILIDTHHLE